MSNAYAFGAPIAIQAAASERAAFIRRTYAHLAGAILAFAAIEFAIFSMLTIDQLEGFMRPLFGNMFGMLIMMAAFIGVSYMAQSWALNSTSLGMQYAGLGLYVLFEAVIFLPLLTVAVYYVGDKTLIPRAGIMTLAVFGGLTAVAFTTKKDFSFLGGILWLGGFLMIGLIIAAIIFPQLGLGLWFSFLGVALASGFILYDTSNVIHRYRTDQHVAASLSLFAAVAMLFYYILRILLATGRD